MGILSIRIGVMPCVLYYDDDPTSLLILRTLLQQRGVHMLEAKTEVEAWAKLESHPEVDLIFLDHNLEEKQGWQWLDVLRKHLLFREIPVVVLTAQAERADVIKYKGLGVFDFILKRPEIKKVETALEQALQYDWRKRLFVAESAFLRSYELYGRLQLLDGLILNEKYLEASRMLGDLLRSVGKAESSLLKSIVVDAQKAIALGAKWEISRIGNRLKLYAQIQRLHERKHHSEYFPTEVASTAVPVPSTPVIRPIEETKPAVIIRDEPYGFGAWAPDDPLDYSQFKPFDDEVIKNKILRMSVQPHWIIYAQCIKRINKGDDGGAERILTENSAYRLVLLEEAFSDPNLDAEFQATFLGLTLKFGIDRLQLFSAMPILFSNTPSCDLPWWLHGFAVGWLAADLRSMAGVNGPLNLPLAGLIHDLGKYLLSQCFGSTYKLLWSMGRGDHQWLRRAESALFYRNHAEIGRDWLLALDLPVLASAVEWHEAPGDCANPAIKNDLRYLRMADLLLRDVGRSLPHGRVGDELRIACDLCNPGEFAAASIPQFLTHRASLAKNLTHELHVELVRDKQSGKTRK